MKYLKHSIACAILLGSAISLGAQAQERAALSKADVEQLAKGKKLHHLRVSDNQKIVWDLREDGTL